MGISIVLEAKVVGSRKPVYSDWTVDLPPRAGGGERMRLRDLICGVVQREVEAFRKRQEERRLARIMSPAQIAQGVERGKLDPHERDLKQGVDTPQAEAAALQAFEDGLYFVFIDGSQPTRLDEEVYVRPGSRVTFLRLVALAGG